MLTDWEKDELLVKSEISQQEFYNLPIDYQLYILHNRDIFYNVNGGTILNLSHAKYKDMSKMLRRVSK